MFPRIIGWVCSDFIMAFQKYEIILKTISVWLRNEVMLPDPLDTIFRARFLHRQSFKIKYIDFLVTEKMVLNI